MRYIYIEGTLLLGSYVAKNFAHTKSKNVRNFY